MKYLFELSKEHQTLPSAEIISCLNSENINYKIIESNEDILVLDIESKKISKLADRLAMTFFVDDYIFSSPIDFDKIAELAANSDINQKGSIAIKYMNRSKSVESQKIVKILAEIYAKGRKVNLEKPDVEVRALITDNKVYVGCKKVEINRGQFEDRKVQNRPFFSPISLHPKLACALVNLSCVRRNEVLLDPFCGTGGFLIEAGLIGAKVIGSDIEGKMIEGCRKTLNHYKIKNFELFHSDIGDINKFTKKVDAIVTDLPYGKSTTTKGEDIKELTIRSFESISNVLKDHGLAVIGLSDSDLISLGEKHMALKEIFEFRVHRSLTRFFAIYAN